MIKSLFNKIFFNIDKYFHKKIRFCDALEFYLPKGSVTYYSNSQRLNPIHWKIKVFLYEKIPKVKYITDQNINL
jgi:hypothetical protein